MASVKRWSGPGGFGARACPRSGGAAGTPAGTVLPHRLGTGRGCSSAPTALECGEDTVGFSWPMCRSQQSGMLLGAGCGGFIRLADP